MGLKIAPLPVLKALKGTYEKKPALKWNKYMKTLHRTIVNEVLRNLITNESANYPETVMNNNTPNFENINVSEINIHAS